MWSPDSIDAWDSELRFSRRRISFICDLISERDDSVYACVIMLETSVVVVMIVPG